MKKVLSTLVTFLITTTTFAQWATNGDNVTIDKNVGIGTTTPTVKLDVNGDIKGNTLHLNTLNPGESWRVSKISYLGHSLRIGSSIGSYAHNTIDLLPEGASQGLLHTSLSMYITPKIGEHLKKILLHSQGNSYFNGGNVGIGTETPQAKLDVEGTGSISNLLKIGKQIDPANWGSVNRVAITPYYHTGGPWYFTSRDTPSMAYLDIMYGVSKLFSIVHTGEVEIGGKLKAREVEITISAGADHVFSNDYSLKPLSEVKSFVEENKHLPEIPSEKEMQENGLNINEFQIKLLQKIEELTLYVIKQDEEIQKLKEALSEK